jgi:hypothetical protein
MNLALNDEENKKKIAAAGGIERVVQAMAAHVTVAIVQQNGCAALMNLASNNDENRKKIAAAGGIEAIKRAKAKHPSCVRNADLALFVFT